MKTLMINLLFALSALLPACTSAGIENTSVNEDDTRDSTRILIVYLSRTSNTKALATMIHEKTGGDLIALELEKPYPENYQAIVKQVADENEKGYLPPLKTNIDSIQNYELVFIGFPTWGMQLPPPMKSFLKQYDLSGKRIIPFNTNAGYGLGNTIETIKAFCPKSTVLEEFSTKGGVERDGIYFVMEGEKQNQVNDQLTAWLQRLKLVINK